MNDLVIGTKRPLHKRPLRSFFLFLGIIAIGSVVAYFTYARMTAYTHPDVHLPEDKLALDATNPKTGLRFGEGLLRYDGNLAILHTSGAVSDLGAQHGRLLGREIGFVQSFLRPTVQQTVSDTGFFASKFQDLLLGWKWRLLDNGLSEHQLVELAALTRGAMASDTPVAFDDLVRQSAFLDIGKPAAGSAGSINNTMARSLTVVTSTSQNHLLVGRTMSLPGAPDGGKSIREHPVLHLVRPKDALAFASLSWPGMTGVVSGMNGARLAVFVHFVQTADVRITRAAQPLSLIARQVLEHAHSLDEAIQILQEANPLGAGIFVVVDGNQQTWGAIERSPTKIEVHKSPTIPVVVDLLEGKSFLDDALNQRARQQRPMDKRRNRAKQLANNKETTPRDVANLLQDRHTMDGAILPLGHRGAIDDTEAIHVALFDPSSMVIWVATTDPQNGFRAIDVKGELSGERPAPPADIPAQDGATGGQVQEQRDTVRAVRQILVEGRRLYEYGQKQLGRELVSHAVTRAPNLPEALLTAGRMAQQDNDALTARAFLRRFLELAPDDPGEEEQVRAWLGL